MTISLDRMIDEVTRELGYRKKVYPRLVSKGKERDSVLVYRTNSMEGVLKLLHWFKVNEAKVKAAIGEMDA